MPWKEVSRLTEQINFIECYLEEGVPLTSRCKYFGISAKTGYRRVARYLERGLEGIGNLTRAPRNHPNATPSAAMELIIVAKRGISPTAPRSRCGSCAEPIQAFISRRSAHAQDPQKPWSSPPPQAPTRLSPQGGPDEGIRKPQRPLAR